MLVVSLFVCSSILQTYHNQILTRSYTAWISCNDITDANKWTEFSGWWSRNPRVAGRVPYKNGASMFLGLEMGPSANSPTEPALQFNSDTWRDASWWWWFYPVSARPWNSNVPIIMLTAVSDENRSDHVWKFGADDHIAKPFSPRHQLHRIKALLRRVQGSMTSRVMHCPTDHLAIGHWYSCTPNLTQRKALEEEDLSARAATVTLFLTRPTKY